MEKTQWPTLKNKDAAADRILITGILISATNIKAATGNFLLTLAGSCYGRETK